MTQEDRKLLLKDLSARLPYKVKIQCINSDNETVIEELFTIGIEEDSFDCNLIEYVSVKPYLFPLSSMNEEQDKEFALLQTSAGKEGFLYAWNCANMMKWLIENHFDYNGLIEKGLAIDATNKNIY